MSERIDRAMRDVGEVFNEMRSIRSRMSDADAAGAIKQILQKLADGVRADAESSARDVSKSRVGDDVAACNARLKIVEDAAARTLADYMARICEMQAAMVKAAASLRTGHHDDESCNAEATDLIIAAGVV